jgi:hypothetical protein
MLLLLDTTVHIEQRSVDEGMKRPMFKLKMLQMRFAVELGQSRVLSPNVPRQVALLRGAVIAKVALVWPLVF